MFFFLKKDQHGGKGEESFLPWFVKDGNFIRIKPILTIGGGLLPILCEDGKD